MAPPSEVKAVVISKPGVAEVQTVSLPSLREDYILVRTTAVAINPTDWKHIKWIEDAVGCRVGCDYAGIVEQVGSKVTKPFAPGDRVCGFVHGSNSVQPEDGAFAEYIVVKGDLQIKIPDNVSDEEAATLGVGITTVAQGLYQSLKLPLPPTGPGEEAANASLSKEDPKSKPAILIYGGSTATGILGIQFASLSGYTVLTTSSPSNFEYLKSLGASLVVDYNSPSAIAEIKDWVANNTNGVLTTVWDCIGGSSSAAFCASVLPNPAPENTTIEYSTIVPVDEPFVKSINPSISAVNFTLAYTAIGEAFGGDSPKNIFARPAIPEDFEFAKMFWELSRELLAQGRIKAARADVNRGGKGLEGVLFGLKELEEGRVSGVKLVYTL